MDALKAAYARQNNERLARDSYRSVDERVNSIIPPLDDLLGLRSELSFPGHDAVLWSTGLRDFAYVHPKITYSLPPSSRYVSSW